jgi:hypothetical protein
MPRPATLDHLRSGKRPVTRVERVVLDPDLAERHAEALQAFETAKLLAEAQPASVARGDDLRDARRALAEAEAEVEGSDAVVTMRFRSIGRVAYDELIERHPPTPDQQERHRRESPDAPPLAYNPDTFEVAVVAASSLEPRLTEAEAKEIATSPDWNGAEWVQLVLAAITVNQQRRVVEMGKGSPRT